MMDLLLQYTRTNVIAVDCRYMFHKRVLFNVCSLLIWYHSVNYLQFLCDLLTCLSGATERCVMLQAALGTNALSVAAGAKGGDGFNLDMATSAVTYGQVLYTHAAAITR